MAPDPSPAPLAASVAVPVPVPVAILVSGRGSNMAALIHATRGDPAIGARVVLVASDQPSAPALDLAAQAAIATWAEPWHRATRAAWEQALDARLRAAGVELVCLAGFMRVLSAGFCGRWAGRLVNIHPSLLPRHPGLDTHARALAAGDQEHGATVHWVTATVDAGPVIDQARVPVLAGDTAETLAARVLAAEHRLYPRALAQVVAGLRQPPGP